VAGDDGALDHQHLADEARERRDAGEAQQAHGHRRGEPRSAVRQAGEALDGVASVVVVHHLLRTANAPMFISV
jgi:hypothetical protein